MNTNRMEAFLKTVELESVSKAASELGITQSAVSHIISDLEDEFGFSLLVRSRQRCYLTPAGERVIPYIKEIMFQYSEMLKEAELVRKLDEGEVRIGTFSSVAVHWLPAILKSFQNDYPGIRFKLYNGDYGDVENWLSNGSIDVGFVALPSAAAKKTIPLFEDELVAILPTTHKFASCDVLNLKDVEDEPFISLLESSSHDMKKALEHAGICPEIKFRSKDDYAIIAMVEQGLGVSIMPELLIRGHSDHVKIMHLDPPSSRTIALALPGIGADSPAAGKFTDYVEKWVQENWDNHSKR